MAYKILRWWLTSLLAVVAFVCAGCGGDEELPPPPLFRQVTIGDLPVLGESHSGTFLDLDNDGFLDLLAPDPVGRIDLFRNGGRLDFFKTDRRQYAGLARSAAHGMAACDFDNDGDWDVFVAADTDRGRAFGRNHLWRREKAGNFVDVGGDDPVLSDPIGRGQGGLWADFDADAQPELLIFNYQSQVRMAAATSAGWRDVTTRLPWPPAVKMNLDGPPPEARLRARSGWIHTAVAADLDGDHRQDLLAIGRPGWSGVLMNQGAGVLAERTAVSGLKHALWPKTPSHVAMGDINEDGRPDLVFCYLTSDEFTRNYAPLEIWRNDSQPGQPAFERKRFVERGEQENTLLTEVGKPESAILADLDNDGHLDLYVVQPAEVKATSPNLLYQGHGDESFSDVSTIWGGGGPPDSAPESAWAVDLDNDGDLDLVTFNGGEPFLPTSLHRGVTVYENLGTGGVLPPDSDDGPRDEKALAAAAAAGGNLGLTIQLVSSTGPPHGLGAVATLVAGESRQVRWSQSLVGGMGTAVLPLHFGVGRTEGPYRLQIRWAGGTQQVFAIPAAGRAYAVREGDEMVVELPRKSTGGGS